MTLSAVSTHMLSNQFTLPHYSIRVSGFPDFTSFYLNEKFTASDCKFLQNWPVSPEHIVPSKRRNGYLRSKASISPSPNGGDKTNSSSHACFEGSVPMVFENEESSKNMEGDPVESSESCLSQSSEHLGKDGNIIDKLKAVHLHALALEKWNASRLKLCHRNYLVSATNLIHYLALKSFDVEQLTEDLLTSLLKLETVIPSLTASIRLLNGNSPLSGNFISGTLSQQIEDKETKFTFSNIKKKASSNAEKLLGSPQDGRTTHIMVTAGQEVIESDTLVTDLLRRGTNVIRINCAHDKPSVWSDIIRRVKTSSQMLEKPCRILMDLAGPKLRTGNLKAGTCVMRISPVKNAIGSVISPARVWLSHKNSGPPPPHLFLDATLSVDSDDFFNKLELGSLVCFRDARGKHRTLKIAERFHAFSTTGFLAECAKTAYVQSGTSLYIKGRKGKSSVGEVVNVPAVKRFVRVRVGDLLIISRETSAEEDNLSQPTAVAHKVTCSSGYLFDSVKPGEPIAFDDGKIWGVIQGTSISEVVVSITHAGRKGTRLGSEKSINIPLSNIKFKGLTSKDLMDLEFVASHADMVGVSFVRDVRDIVVLRQELEKRKLPNLGIVLKIETKGAFQQLPLMLLEAMKSPNPLGVMIARGDLAVECGWESLADIQEEILSICNAAHVPVIWATQVLESLVKSGVPSRAEITDVANGRRARCIMLNKGKHILEAVSTADNILRSSSVKTKAELLNSLMLYTD